MPTFPEAPILASSSSRSPIDQRPRYKLSKFFAEHFLAASAYQKQREKGVAGIDIEPDGMSQQA